MNLEEMRKKTIEYLEKTYKKKGFQDLLWNSKQSMLERYKAIIAMVDLRQQVVLDVGCGYCDFYDFLESVGIKVREYVGVDLHPEIVKEARRRHPHLVVKQADFLEVEVEPDNFDYCIGCGIVTFAIDCWEERTERMMRRMFESARKGIIVDFLKDREGGHLYMGHIPPKDPKSYYCKMSEALKIAEKIAPYVNLKNDYRFNSFCLTLLKYEN